MVLLQPDSPESYRSPKRKRDEREHAIDRHFVRQPLPHLHTTGQQWPLSRLDTLTSTAGDGSPRTNVAGRLQVLEIQDRFDLNNAIDKAGLEVDAPAQDTAWSHTGTGALSDEECQAPTRLEYNSQDVLQHPRHKISTSVESPASPSDEHPHTKRRSRSPPLNGQPQDSFWHESEITGHLMMDPNDDGYGINGIGFKPTPAAAWARSQRRKQQLANYKSREAREARERRSERRRLAPVEEHVDGKDEITTKKVARVRFQEALS